MPEQGWLRGLHVASGRAHHNSRIMARRQQRRGDCATLAPPMASMASANRGQFQSTCAPQVILRAAAVMVRARSEATKAATSPTSSSVAARFSIVRRTISSVIAWRPSRPSGIVLGTPPVCKVTTRMPCGPSSQARFRRSASIAGNATWRPPSQRSRRCRTRHCQDRMRPTACQPRPLSSAVRATSKTNSSGQRLAGTVSFMPTGIPAATA